MRLRTQFTITFLMLAIVPLAGIVLFSYLSARDTLKQAVAAETAALAEEMRDRFALEKDILGRRVEAVGLLPLGLLTADGEEAAEIYDEAVLGLGDDAEFLEALTFVPAAPVPKAAARPFPEKPPVQPAPPVGEQPVPSEPESWLSSGEMQEIHIRAREELAPEVERLVLNGLELAATFVDSESFKAAIEAELAEAQSDIEDLREDSSFNSYSRVTTRRSLTQTSVLESSTGKSGDKDIQLVIRTLDGAVVPALEAAAKRIDSHVPVIIQSPGDKGDEASAPGSVETIRVLGTDFRIPVSQDGRVLGEVVPSFRGEAFLARLLNETAGDPGDVPFVVDGSGGLHASGDVPEELLDRLQELGSHSDAGGSVPAPSDDDSWIVVSERDPESGLILGVARPMGESLAAIRALAARNLLFGSGLIGLALLGVLPLSRRLTREVRVVSDGARRLGEGELDTRVEVGSRSEMGELAGTFNWMAEELSRNQDRLLEEERRRRDQEVHTKLLAAESDRKSKELEEARRFQLSLLPEELPSVSGLDFGVSTRTATEVGGDYYDFRALEDGSLVVAVGDATGHGARAGTMVTVIKSVFTAAPELRDLVTFLEEASRTIRRMKLGRMAMGLTLARIKDNAVTVAAAGMPPALVYRAETGEVEELDLQGVPLGSPLDFSYCKRQIELGSLDTLLFMTDGLPELQDSSGEPFGYPRVRVAFQKNAQGSPAQILEALSKAAEEWNGGEAPGDDVTFVVVKAT